MSSEPDIPDSSSADARMLRLAGVLDRTATAAAIIMPVAALAQLAQATAYFSQNVSGGAARVAIVFPLLIMSLVRGAANAFEFALSFAFIWFFARYFAYVLETRAQALRPGAPSDVVETHVPAGP